ncbi:MAG: hypothetical protein ACE5QF_06395 [Thermoplasmata archaeon]
MSPIRRGRMIYYNPVTRKSARRLRIRGTIIGLSLITMGTLSFFGSSELMVLWIVLGVIALIIGTIVIAESNSTGDFRVHEKGIKLAGHGLPDVLQNPFIWFDSISRIVVHSRGGYLTVIHKDARDEHKSDDVWRSDVEGDFSEVIGILRDRAEMEMA